MTRYTSERGYGLDLSGPDPVWRGKKRRWSHALAIKQWWLHSVAGGCISLIVRNGYNSLIPRYRIDEYIKRGLIDPARRDDL